MTQKKPLPFEFLIRKGQSGIIIMRGNIPCHLMGAFDMYQIAGKQVMLFVHAKSSRFSPSEMKQAKRMIEDMIRRNMRDHYQLYDKETRGND